MQPGGGTRIIPVRMYQVSNIKYTVIRENVFGQLNLKILSGRIGEGFLTGAQATGITIDLAANQRLHLLAGCLVRDISEI